VQALNLENNTSHDGMSWTDVSARRPTTSHISIAASADQRHSRSPSYRNFPERRGSGALRTPYKKPLKTAARFNHVSKNMNSCLLCSIQKQACDRGFPDAEGPKDGHRKTMPCSREYLPGECYVIRSTNQPRYQDASGWVTSNWMTRQQTRQASVASTPSHAIVRI
jgi:hypothetical protein